MDLYIYIYGLDLPASESVQGCFSVRPGQVGREKKESKQKTISLVEVDVD